MQLAGGGINSYVGRKRFVGSGKFRFQEGSGDFAVACEFECIRVQRISVIPFFEHVSVGWPGGQGDEGAVF